MFGTLVVFMKQIVIAGLVFLMVSAYGVDSVHAASAYHATHVRTVDTALFSPPSPDASGVEYLPIAGHILISDAEVEEMPLFAGANLFEIATDGTLAGTGSTVLYSNEPTGLGYNPATNHLFVSDDVVRKIFEVDHGTDGRFGTADDQVVRSVNTTLFGNSDPEGVTFHTGDGALYIAGGISSAIYRLLPGANGIFDGIAPAGDDQVSSFSTSVHGVTDPEGIAANTDTGTLYIVGKPATVVIEVTTAGTLLTTIDISEAHAKKPAGLAYAPSSINPSTMNLYIVERGVDNNSDPNENDGKLYEMTLPPLLLSPTPTLTPVLSPTPALSITVSPTPPVQHCTPLGDIDCSGNVNLFDLSTLLLNMNKADAPTSDLDNSGQVNLPDLMILLSHYGQSR